MNRMKPTHASLEMGLNEDCWMQHQTLVLGVIPENCQGWLRSKSTEMRDLVGCRLANSGSSSALQTLGPKWLKTPCGRHEKGPISLVVEKMIPSLGAERNGIVDTWLGFWMCATVTVIEWGRTLSIV